MWVRGRGGGEEGASIRSLCLLQCLTCFPSTHAADFKSALVDRGVRRACSVLPPSPTRSQCFFYFFPPPRSHLLIIPVTHLQTKEPQIRRS